MIKNSQVRAQNIHGCLCIVRKRRECARDKVGVVVVVVVVAVLVGVAALFVVVVVVVVAVVVE